MRILSVLSILLLTLVLSSCWKIIGGRPGDPVDPPYQPKKVWGYKAVYAKEVDAKKITYLPQAQPVQRPGNIYAKGNYIFQMEIGRGIHVIDNSIPATAQRIGFLTMNGCSQISIKGNYLYTDSYEDLVVVNIADLNNVAEVKRVTNAFPEARWARFNVEPPNPGYYTCPRYDSLVVGWTMDSVFNSCRK